MKKSYALALWLSAFAVSSFAQDVATFGARRVAERDTAYVKAHPIAAQQVVPAAVHTKKHRGHTRHKQHATAKKIVR